MIDFKPVDIQNRDLYQSLRDFRSTKGCEYSFSNLLLWGSQKMAFLHGCALIYAKWGDFQLYTYPVGQGDRKAAIEALILDAQERNIPLRFGGIDEYDRQELERFFPGEFRFRENRRSFDYVYDINALADLSGRKLSKKRNHIHRFEEAHPEWYTVPMTAENLAPAKEFAANWYTKRLEADPEGDFDSEKTAMDRAFRNFEALNMTGLYLMEGEQVLAFTFGSRMSPDTFDTHFEKADANEQGAYTIINREFARMLRANYPELKYIDREDDMGLPGLRKAKLSYAPDHLIEKSIAYPASEEWDED